VSELNRCTCAEAFQRLDCYVDRELDEDEIRAVTEHLEKCHACAQEFRFESKVLEEIRAKINRVAVPEGLRDRIFARLREVAVDQ
jgi:anti-sigma factor (TIGR02949 family)